MNLIELNRSLRQLRLGGMAKHPGVPLHPGSSLEALRKHFEIFGGLSAAGRESGNLCAGIETVSTEGCTKISTNGV